MQTDYQKQGTDFLESHGLTFRAVLVGNDCPAWCQDAEKDLDMNKLDTYPRHTHIHGKHYRCTIAGKDRGHFSIDFWSSYHDEERNWYLTHRWQADYRLERAHKGHKRAQVTPYDVLACITKHDPGSFENFCMEYGYDTDSRKTEDVYRAVVKEWAKVARFFTAAEIEQLQEIN